MKLFQKTFLLVGSCLAISMMALTSMNIFSFKTRYTENLKKEVKISTSYWIEKISMSLPDSSFEELAGQYSGMTKNFQDQSTTADFFEISILSKKGMILSSSSPSRWNHTVGDVVINRLRDGKTIQIIKNENEGVYEVVRPIIHDESVVGYILVRYQQDIIDGVINQEILKSTVITAISLITSLIIFAVFIKILFINQINQILATIQKIEDTKDLSLRIESNSKDEIGDLIQKLNEFFEFIQRAKEFLEQTLKKHQGNPKQLTNFVLIEEVLTEQETKVYQYIVKRGLSNKEIADILDIKEGTVRNHITSIHKKLGYSIRKKTNQLPGQSIPL